MFVNDSLLRISYCLSRSFRLYKTFARQRHWPKHHAKIRAKLVAKIDLPDFQKIRNREKGDFREKREFMRKEGLPLLPDFRYLPINLTSSGEVMERFKPPEGDGFQSSSSSSLLKGSSLTNRGSTWKALRRISNDLPDFDKEFFANEAQNTYNEAHEALASWNLDRIRELVTERCYGDMVVPLERKTVTWSLVQSLEPPNIVHARVGDMLQGKFVVAQITVRFFTQQKVALFDRFGRLLAGSLTDIQDVLEYIVFERMLSNVYSSWRIHDKIVPEWAKQRAHGIRHTFAMLPKVPDSLIDQNASEINDKKEIPDNQLTVEHDHDV